MNWRGRLLTSHEVIVQSIAATTTHTGLHVTARLDAGTYPTGVAIGDAEMAVLPLTRHAFQGDWNYVLRPQPTPTVPAARAPQPANAGMAALFLADAGLGSRLATNWYQVQADSSA